MSLKGIRSRLRQSTGGTDSDQGSPSRSSFFHQLAAFLGPDEPNTSAKGTFSPEDDANAGGNNFEAQLLSLVMSNGERASAISMANSTGSKLDAIPTAASSCSEPDGEPINTKLPQSAGSPSPATRHKMLVHNFVAKDSFDLAGSDRETDKDGSVTEDSRTRRPLANSIRRRALQSSTSGHSEQAQQQQQPQQQQPMNSSPGTTPRRNRFVHRDKRRSERSLSLDRSVRSASIPPSLENNTSALTTESSNMSTTISFPPFSEEDEEETSSFKEDGIVGADIPSRLPHNRIAAWARELMDDLQSIEDADQTNSTTKENGAEDLGESLAVKRLKNNIMRFGRITSSISSSCDSIQSLRQWQSPTASILFILVSSYAIWHGLFFSFVVAASLWKLTMNYLTTQGWLRHFGATANGSQHQDAEETSNDGNKASGSVAERLAVVLQVARKVQNQLGAVCDAAEKIKNLLMWRHEASRRLYLMLWLALSLTLVVPAAQLSTFVGFYLLFKLMVVDYVFYKFPRLRAKYDTSSFMWQTLPTDADLDARHKVEQGLRNAAASAVNTETRTFWESFNLPPNEQPLPGWQNGLRSTLVNRDKSLTSSFKSGRLFLTASYLCFERSKTQPGKNVVIPLDRIVRLEKGNQYTWIPGGGMIIEVFVQGLDRAYTFGAILNRDDVFNAIRDAAEKVGCVWREDKSGTS